MPLLCISPSRLLPAVLLTVAGLAAHADLAPDVTFAGDGAAAINLGPGFDFGTAIVRHADGGYVVGGFSAREIDGTALFRVVVARYAGDGTLVAGFGDAGVVELGEALIPPLPAPVPPALFVGGQVTALAVQPADGRIVVAGIWSADGNTVDPFLLRLLADGGLDPSFGTGGVRVFGEPELADAAPRAIAVDSAGRIVVAGYTDRTGQPDEGMVLRLLADGSFDAGFASGGIYLREDPDASSLGFRLNGLALLSGDRILAAGGSLDAALLQLDATGTPDPAFGDDGVAVWAGDGGSDDMFFGLVVEGGGPIMAVGSVTAGGNADGLMVRFAGDGQVDAAFGSDGVLLLPDDGSGEFLRSVAWRSAGDYVVGGNEIRPLQVSPAGTALSPLGSEPVLRDVGALVADGDDVVGVGVDATTTPPPDSQFVTFRLAVTDLPDETDTVPDAFAFTAQEGVATSAFIVSDAATITGITAAAPVSVAGGEFSVNCTGTWRSTDSLILGGQTICVRHVSSAAPGGVTETTLTIGGVGATFTSTTRDDQPDAFTFTPQTGVRLVYIIVSEAITIGGIDAPTRVLVANGEVSIGCNDIWYTARETRETVRLISEGEQVCVRHLAAPLKLQTVTTTLTLGGTVVGDTITGGVSGTFSSTTTDGKPLPGSSALDPWSLGLLGLAALCRRRRCRCSGSA